MGILQELYIIDLKRSNIDEINDITKDTNTRVETTRSEQEYSNTKSLGNQEKELDDSSFCLEQRVFLTMKKSQRYIGYFTELSY